jgi:hypothetical protein
LRCAVASRLFGVGIGARAHKIAFADKRSDLFLRAIVLFDKSAIRFARQRVGKDYPTAQRRMSFKVDRAHRSLIHEKNDLAPRFI